MLGEGGLGSTLADELYLGNVVRLDLPPISRIYALFAIREASNTALSSCYRLCEYPLPQTCDC